MAMYRRFIAVAVLPLLLTVTACGSSTTGSHGESISLPDSVTVIMPNGSATPDLKAMFSDDGAKVRVISVDGAGVPTVLADVDLTGGDDANPDLVEAARVEGLRDLEAVEVPQGSGYGDVLAGARQAAETRAGDRIVVLHSGCLEVAGARLTGADLSTDDAIDAAAAAFETHGAVDFEQSATVILAGAGACSANSADAQARLGLLNELCRRTETPCAAREAEVAR